MVKIKGKWRVRMASETVYIKLERNAIVQENDVFFSNISKVRCSNVKVEAKIKSLKVHHFSEKNSNCCVVDIIKLVELIEKNCGEVSIECLGETECFIKKTPSKKKKKISQGIKIFLVSAITFFGTTFTIMAYHNDVGITDLFDQIHYVVTGEIERGLNILELSYSIGLGIGIIIFFNHIGKTKFTKDPTPIEVSIRNYEEDVNKTIIEMAEREGKTK